MPPAKKPRQAPPDQRIIDAMLTLVLEKGWMRVGLADIASEAKVSLAELHEHYGSKIAILAACMKRVDHTVLAGTGKASDSETVRDRLFDIMMRRFDALKPDKAAISALLRDVTRDPPTALFLACRAKRSMRWMLEAAGVPTGGLLGKVQTKGLLAIYMATLRVWLQDDSEDMGKTMAFLDKRLSRAETVMNRACGFLRPGRRREAEPVVE
jgi:AcrR family transcriptional regulator